MVLEQKETIKEGLILYGDNINFDVIAKLHSILEDQSPLPYLFDIVDYTHLNHLELKAHIDGAGEIVYER